MPTTIALSEDVIERAAGDDKTMTVQKGRNYLDGKLAEEVQADADAVIEEVLGRAWQLTEL